MAIQRLLLFVLVSCSPVVAHAVTIDDLIALSRAGLSDDVLTAVIDADGTVFDLTPDQIIELKSVGLSDMVLRRMIRSRTVAEESTAAGALD